MSYEWDWKKASINQKKHGIDFADALAVFKDDYALMCKDEFVEEEQRFLAIGIDYLARVIAVISARPATKKERKAYESKRG